MLAKKFVDMLSKKCDQSGISLDDAVAFVEDAMTKFGMTEQNAVLLWASENSSALKRTKLDLDAVIVHWDSQGRTVQKEGKDLVVHELVILAANKDAKGKVESAGIFQSSIWAGGDRGDSPFIAELDKLSSTTVYLFKGVGVDMKTNKFILGEEASIVASSTPFATILSSVPPTWVSSALDNLDQTMLYRGTVIRSFASKQGVGVEVGHIPDDSLEIPSPVTVWFQANADMTPDALAALSGQEVNLVARFYLKKTGELGATGYIVIPC